MIDKKQMSEEDIKRSGKIMYYKVQPSEKDSGDASCEERLRFEEYLKMFRYKGSLIATNVADFELLTSPESNNFALIAPAFFQSALYNCFSVAIIQLAAFFSQDDTASFHKFINFTEQNQKKIFTKIFFEEKVGMPNTKKQITIDSFHTRKERVQQEININEEAIQRIKDERDKVFAHFEKEYLITGKWQQLVSLDDLKSLLRLMEKVVNEIGVIYDRIYRRFTPINVEDANQVFYVCDLYMKYKSVLLTKENENKKQLISQ